MSAKRKLLISVLLMLFVCLAVVVTVSTVFSLTQQTINTTLNMSYVVENIEGMVSASYRIGSTTGDLIAEADADHKSADGKSLIFKQEDVDHAGNLNFPDGTLTLTSENSEIIIEYKYTNTGSRHYIATMSFDSELIRNNMVVEYSIDGVNYDIYRYAVVVPEGAVNKPYWIKIRVDDLLENASFVGDLDWELKGCDPEDEDYLFWESVNLTGNETTGEYSATFSGVAPANGLINFPSEVNGYPVTKIIAGSSSNKSTVTSVFIPDSVTEIEGNAFYSFDNLQTVTFEQNGSASVASTQSNYGLEKIGMSSFAFCSKLTEIQIPNTVTYIDIDAFNGCSIDNVIIPDSVETVSLRAFRGCGKESVYIGKNVTRLGDHVFYADPEDLSNITIHAENTTIRIENYCLISYQSLIKGCDKSVIPNNVQYIGIHAFEDCLNLESIEIPDSVEIIAASAFVSCSNLTNVKIGIGFRSIRLGLSQMDIFPYCSKLTTIVVDEENQVYRSENNCIIERETNKLVSGGYTTAIPDGVMSIGEHAFIARDILTTLTIPASVTTIEGNAFYGCSNLTSVTFEVTSGWKQGSQEIDESQLQNASNAAALLTAYHSSYWTLG